MIKNIPYIRRIKPSPLRIFSAAGHFTLSSAQEVGKNQLRWFLAYPLLLSACQPLAEVNPAGNAEKPVNQRYVTVESSSSGHTPQKSSHQSRCIFDKKTHLTWEVKTNGDGLQNASQTYSWYDSNAKSNGGYSGHRRQGNCELAFCDTQSYVAAINKLQLCGHSNWRLPNREELRSLVDYNIVYPGPTINQLAFPNTISQFYWSSTANANDSETAWGIGFSFGYDYAYFKSDHGYIRLVSGPNK